MHALPQNFRGYRDFLRKNLPLREKSLYWRVVNLDEEIKLCVDFEESGIQSALSFRAVSRARLIAAYLIDEKGELDEERLSALIDDLNKNLYSYMPDGENDAALQEHILRILLFLQKDYEAKRFLKRFHLPIHSILVQELILESLGGMEGVTKRGVRMAVLCALFTPLRQTLGSCFATAPAILVQQEAPFQLLSDLYDLIEKNVITRTIQGHEVMAPLSPSPGYGDLIKKPDIRFHLLLSPGLKRAYKSVGLDENDLLKNLKRHSGLSINEFFKKSLGRKNEPKLIQTMQREFRGLTQIALLKAWEFSIATFSDYKIDFYKWGLFHSLGLDPSQKGGVGEILNKELEEEAHLAKGEVEKLSQEVDYAYSRLMMVEKLLKTVDTPSRARQLKTEHTLYLNEFYSLQDIQRKKIDRVEKSRHFFQFLLNEMQEALKGAFGEVYDPLMFENEIEDYQDAPAGFRLVYKHGRTDPHLWTSIDSKESYVDALFDFFQSFEHRLLYACEWEEGKALIPRIIGILLRYIREDRFYEGALKRIQVFYTRFRFEKATPYSYVSGGSMKTLTAAYFGLENELKEEVIKVESESDLLIFLLDQLKSMPWMAAKRFVDEPHRALLMSSPQHAFCLKPGYDVFKKAWLDDGFSYTYVRDEIINKSAIFYSDRLREEEQSFLIDLLYDQFFPFWEKPRLSKGEKSVQAFREELFGMMKEKKTELLDHILYLCLPFFSREKASVIEKKIFKQAPQIRFPSFMPYFGLLESLKALDLTIKTSVSTHINHDYEMRKKLEEFGFGPPPALLFADSNWAHFDFGFVYNPGTAKLELWRLDRSSQRGFPMRTWKPDLKNGAEWTLITEPVDRRKSFPELFLV
ncbi:MAG: hypothetical protein WDZ28_00215 [Simkaniaceae bacterium]